MCMLRRGIEIDRAILLHLRGHSGKHALPVRFHRILLLNISVTEAAVVSAFMRANRPILSLAACEAKQETQRPHLPDGKCGRPFTIQPQSTRKAVKFVSVPHFHYHQKCGLLPSVRTTMSLNLRQE